MIQWLNIGHVSLPQSLSNVHDVLWSLGSLQGPYPWRLGRVESEERKLREKGAASGSFVGAKGKEGGKEERGGRELVEKEEVKSSGQPYLNGQLNSCGPKPRGRPNYGKVACD